MTPIILSGGSGTRLWPYSRKYFPKQFLSFANEESLFQETLKRLEGLNAETPLVISNEAHRFIVAEQLRQSECEAPIILESVGRNTAPAVALAAIHAITTNPEAVLLVLPADHIISNIPAFHKALQTAQQHAKTGKLVTFGIVPTAAETGFGYIQTGTSLISSNEESPHQESYIVQRFIEKPDHSTATQYLANGEYLWNSGMFMFKASRYLEELKQYRPDILQACQDAMTDTSTDMDFIRLNATAFETCPSESIDYAVMENTEEAIVVPLDAGWNDVGSWSALWDVSEKDANANHCRGDIITQNTENSLLFAENRLLATVGIDNMIVIETQDAVLVANKAHVQDVKAIVKQLDTENRIEKDFHRTVYRPWGNYDSVDSGSRFQVKRITVNPGAILSLQKHHHRAEHWIVVKGTAEVTCDDKVFLLTENQSTYIPLGSTHRLANPGKVPLELIEVQSGSYLGEDDIVRFDDQYGRVEQ